MSQQDEKECEKNIFFWHEFDLSNKQIVSEYSSFDYVFSNLEKVDMDSEGTIWVREANKQKLRFKLNGNRLIVYKEDDMIDQFENLKVMKRLTWYACDSSFYKKIVSTSKPDMVLTDGSISGLNYNLNIANSEECSILNIEFTNDFSLRNIQNLRASVYFYPNSYCAEKKLPNNKSKGLPGEIKLGFNYPHDSSLENISSSQKKYFPIFKAYGNVYSPN